MSSIASFYRIARADLEADGGVAELLEQASDVGEDYGWSGYVMLNLLMTLEESGVTLGADLPDGMESEESGAVFFATSGDLAVVEGLDLNRIDLEWFGDGLEMDRDELRDALADSVTTLHQLIAGTRENEVLVIRID